MSTREAIKTIVYILATLALVVGAVWWLGGCGDRGIKDLPSRPDAVPPAGNNLIKLTWDPEDTYEAYTIPLDGRIGYEVCWSQFEAALSFNGWYAAHVGYNEFRQDVMCVDIPDTQRATVEFPDGHWFAAVRAVYVDPNPANPTGVWKTKFSNVIEVRTRPLIATPIEGIGP